MTYHAFGAGTALLLACASPSATAPFAMSAAEHEAAARRDDESSAEHRARYDPNAWEVRTCPPRYGTLIPVCRPDARNPTAGHLDEAQRGEEEAERHRAASRELRQSEEAACADVAPGDRERGPFLHASDILTVEPLAEGDKVVGAVATFLATAGVTPEALERVSACHAASNAVLGERGVGMARCPLAVRGVRVHAVASPQGIALELWAADAEQAREIVERARAALARVDRAR